jgi:hypothetical protein
MTTEQLPTQTTDAGIPVESDDYSLTVGAGGPVRLQDSYPIEQMAQWNRPDGTEGWTEDQLAKIVTRDGMIGVALRQAQGALPSATGGPV